MSHGNLDQTVPQLPNVPTLELLQRHCYLKPMDIISMKESFLWGGGGGGLQIHKHWEHLQGFSQKKKVKIAVFLH